MEKRYIRNCTGGHSPTKKIHAPDKKWSRVVFYILLFAFIVETIYVLFFSPYLQITTISFTGNQELKTEELKQKMQPMVEGKFLGILGKNNFLFLSQSRVEDLLKKDFKKIRSVVIEKKFPDTINIKIDERKALLIWCSDEQHCYLVDENGTVYNQADFNSSELKENNLLRINDQSRGNVFLGDKIMNQQYEQYVLAVRDAIKNIGLELSDQYVTPSRMAEEVSVKTVQGFDIYFSTQFALDSAIRTLNVVLKKEISQEQIANLAYIDLRVENEAFYKLNNQQALADPTENQNNQSQASESDKNSSEKEKE